MPHQPTSSDPVTVADYDPRWPVLFQEERARIAEALGELALAIEHVGSTAVPGLAAKPVIDIMIGVRELAAGERCVAALEDLGYEYRGDGGIPDRHYFRRGAPRTHHIHLVAFGGDFWDRHIRFRDLLRERPDVAEQYAALKRQLAAQYRTDRLAYTEAKTPFIEGALENASRSAAHPRGP